MLYTILFAEFSGTTVIVQQFRIGNGYFYIIVHFKFSEDAAERHIIKAVQSFFPSQIFIRREYYLFAFPVIVAKEFLFL